MKSKTKVGIALFGLCAVSAVATYDSFSMASMILYRNPYIIPAATTTFIVAFAAALMAGYSFIESIATSIIGAVKEDLEKEEE
jgi:hypothetical protein